MKSILKLTAFLGALAAAPALHAEVISILAGGHATAATQQATTYAASCPGVAYQLKIDKPEKATHFIVDAGNGPTITDLSPTPFGTALRTNALLGNFGFACVPDALVINFIGLQLRQGAQPKPVQYRLTIAKNGDIVADNGLADERLEFVNQMLAKP